MTELEPADPKELQNDGDTIKYHNEVWLWCTRCDTRHPRHTFCPKEEDRPAIRSHQLNVQNQNSLPKAVLPKAAESGQIRQNGMIKTLDQDALDRSRAGEYMKTLFAGRSPPSDVPALIAWLLAMGTSRVHIISELVPAIQKALLEASK